VNIPICKDFSIYEVKVADIISVCHQQGVCYAFVEFENSISAQNAIEASPVSIGGRPAYVEEKRPMGSRGPISLPCYSVLQPNSLYLNHFLLSSINTY
jgi:hypothetical protein